MERLDDVGVMFLLMVSVFAGTSCRKAASRVAVSPVRISLCELYGNPSAYDGKLVTVTATITQLPNGKYLYPGSSRDCIYSFIKVDTNHVQNSELTEIESSQPSSTIRKEFDLELTGTFDAKYTEDWNAFRYRIVPIEIKPLSPIRIGKLLGAA